MRLVFAGTPQFAIPSLQAALESGHELTGVFTQPDRPTGRGRKTLASPVKKFAQTHDLPLAQPERFDAHAISVLADWKPDLLVVVAFGMLLPKKALDETRLGAWNIHASLLPRWRGAAPIQRAILAGDRETGICLMQLTPGLDEGPVLASQRIMIGEDERADELHDRLALLGARLLKRALANPEKLQPQPQAETGIRYAKKISPGEGVRDWGEDAIQLARAVRAFYPRPGVRLRLAGNEIRVLRAAALPLAKPGTTPGTVIEADSGQLLVATGDGALRIEELQLPGRKAVSATEFLNAQGRDMLASRE